MSHSISIKDPTFIPSVINNSKKLFFNISKFYTMENNSLFLIKNVKLLLKLVLCTLTLMLMTVSCKKETSTVTPLPPKNMYTAADVVGAYTVKKSEWSDNPLGIGPVGSIITFTLVSKDQVNDGYLTYHVDSLGFLTAPPRPNTYTVSAFGSYDLKAISLTFTVTKDNSTTSGNVFMTKP